MQVVAPVRESAAQALGAALQILDHEDLAACALLLLQLVGRYEKFTKIVMHRERKNTYLVTSFYRRIKIRATYNY